MNAKTNTTTTTTFEIGTAVTTPKGAGTLVSIAKGWATIDTGDGNTIKARVGDLSAPVEVKTGYVKSGKLVYLREAYVKHDVKTPSGRKAFDTNDKVAAKLRGLDLDQAYAEAAIWCDIPESELRAKYGHLNPGMQRMNLGNKMRAA